MTKEFRTEKDSMGEFQVPIDANYGASTARAVENFPVSNLKFTRSFIRALGEIKKACAYVNLNHNLLNQEIAEAIINSSQKVADGVNDDDFVLDIFQTGSGTSTNMNANEVIAALASQELNKEIHPNDHVNMSQSSNDVIPTATNIAAVVEIKENLIPAIDKLIISFEEKGKLWEKVYKNGRTHLMDATPVSLGQEFSGYAALIKERKTDIENSLVNVSKLAIGGTAVGTGINAPANFGSDVCSEISKSLEVSFQEIDNHFTLTIIEGDIVENIYINNNVWVKDDLIIQNLRSKNKSFLTKNNIQNDIKIIKNIYKSKGFKDVSVIAKVEKYSQDRVNLIYKVEENEQQKINI